MPRVVVSSTGHSSLLICKEEASIILFRDHHVVVAAAHGTAFMTHFAIKRLIIIALSMTTTSN
jgi:hypothetical protein